MNAGQTGCSSILYNHSMKKNLFLFGLLAGSILLAACSLKSTPDPNVQIQLAVASTLAAIPASTTVPTNRPYPTPTPFSLTGLFCEYQFCIGHPPEMAFYDVVAKQNHDSPVSSTSENGILAAHNNNLFIELMWQYSPGATDAIFLIDLILEDGLDTPVGTYNLKLIHDMNVLSSPITTTVSPLLTFGGVAGWVCGERAFAWKAYTASAESFEALLTEALDRFECGIE
jgi:hypothetical protein